jgi:hypothetical protein
MTRVPTSVQRQRLSPHRKALPIEKSARFIMFCSGTLALTTTD